MPIKMLGTRLIFVFWIVPLLKSQIVCGQRHTETYIDFIHKALDFAKNIIFNKINAKDFQTSLQHQSKPITEIASKLEQNLYKVLSSPEFLSNRLKWQNHLQQNDLQEEIGEMFNISNECFNQLMFLRDGISSKEKWAMEMLDSNFKPPSGILRGALSWFGNYEECINISVHDSEESDIHFNGKYCSAVLLKIPVVLKSVLLEVGLCVPNGCSEQDVTTLVNTALDFTGLNRSLDYDSVTCQETHKLSGRAIIALIILIIFLVLLIAGTGYDIFLKHFMSPRVSTETISLLLEKQHYVDSVKKVKHETSLLEEMLLSFSVCSNIKNLLKTEQSDFRSIYGVRFFSMCWIILCHSIGFLIPVIANLVDFIDNIKDWTVQPIISGSLSVDNFFAISGLLLTYLTLVHLKTYKGKINWFQFYFHRFWRLTPTLAVLLLIYVTLFEYLGDGPLWPKHGFTENYCEDTWWRTLLYIQNLWPAKDICMGWTWYLADDMQFFAISPLIILPLFKFPVLGYLVFSIFLLGSTIATGIISNINDALPYDLSQDTNDPLSLLYVKPWSRIGPFLIGMFTGYILFKTKAKFQLKWYVNLMCWAVSIALALSVIFALLGVFREDVVLTTDISASYNALARTAWSVSLCWWIFACCTGNGGFINSFLSWKGFVPLSKLTYITYLIHPMIIYMTIFSRRSLYYVTVSQFLVSFMGFVTASYLVSFIASLAFEAPMVRLERVILSRKMRS